MNDWLEYKIILDNKILIKNLENSLIINKNYNNRIKEWINPKKKYKLSYYIDYLEMVRKFLNFMNYVIIKDLH